jgi:hypothetical protein
MKKIGVLFGIENSFPGALVEAINNRRIDSIRAEFVLLGAPGLETLDRLSDYSVIVDRISHEIPFYRAWLKQAALHGTVVINNPFWASADDKFFNYSLASKLGVAVPPTVMLPHKQLPGETTARSMRNLEYPLDWDAVFAYVGEHGFIKPIDGRGWRGVSEVRNRDEFFTAYDASGTQCMVYQKAVNFTEYFRCFVVGGKRVRIMAYDPRQTHAERYVKALVTSDIKLLKRMEKDAARLCCALGYELNTVEFAVENGIPYAIDFMNPVPDADPESIGQDHMDWLIQSVADRVIACARTAAHKPLLPWPFLPDLKADGTKHAINSAAKSSKIKVAKKKIAARSKRHL